MIIATWNVERLKHINTVDLMKDLCQKSNASILVLTETDSRFKLDYKNIYCTLPLGEYMPELYSPFENRVTICTNYTCVNRYDTYDNYSSICVELETEYGNLIIYGTIIGAFGNRNTLFHTDLEKQMADIRRLASLNKNICVVGDYNLSFCDNYYYTKAGRRTILDTLEKCGITILTQNQEKCIDHIAISETFISGIHHSVREWNTDYSLSDHKGILVDLN